MRNDRDHGGGIDDAIQQYGGTRTDWIDLSTGINPVPFPITPIPPASWGQLPDQGAVDELIDATRHFWNIPKDRSILPVPGCSAAIAQIPFLFPRGTFDTAEPTYNEHRASFEYAGWTGGTLSPDVAVIVHPNNPTGHFHDAIPNARFKVIDESFCDIAPLQSMMNNVETKNTLILKSFGKFWGLAGLRLGFVIGDNDLISDLKNRLGPWVVSGPALTIGTLALTDPDWAETTRARLREDAQRLDGIMASFGGAPFGDVTLFRTYEVPDAKAAFDLFAKEKILTRIFPYSDNWIRLGIPGPSDWNRLEAAI